MPPKDVGLVPRGRLIAPLDRFQPFRQQRRDRGGRRGLVRERHRAVRLAAVPVATAALATLVAAVAPPSSAAVGVNNPVGAAECGVSREATTPDLFVAYCRQRLKSRVVATTFAVVQRERPRGNQRDRRRGNPNRLQQLWSEYPLETSGRRGARESRLARPSSSTARPSQTGSPEPDSSPAEEEAPARGAQPRTFDSGRIGWLLWALIGAGATVALAVVGVAAGSRLLPSAARAAGSLGHPRTPARLAVARSGARLAPYLAIVLVSLGLAIGLVTLLSRLAS